VTSTSQYHRCQPVILVMTRNSPASEHCIKVDPGPIQVRSLLV